MNESIEKISRMLRVDSGMVEKLVATMEHITEKKSVVQDVLIENEQSVKKTLSMVDLPSHTAEDIAKALEDTLLYDDKELFKLLGKPNLSSPEQSRQLIEKAYEAVGGEVKGFFLKEAKARQILLETPPPAIIRGLGYTNVDELLQKERLEEIYAALRFIETRDWMNQVLVKQYEKLTPEDFEERPLELIVLQEKWLALAEKFLEKKYHNVSHLKELGVVFVIPIKLDTPGETLRLFSLLLHYLYEVPFYATLIRAYAKHSDTFAAKLMSLIRGDVGEGAAEFSDGFARWLIVQRYLAKDDEHDARLFLPHVNPEAIHWRKAQRALSAFASKYPQLKMGLFAELDHVGEFFPAQGGAERLVSFDLVDNVMGLVKRDVLIKYLYHQQEALWNRIFAGYVGEEEMEKLILEHLDSGYIELTK